MLTLLVILVVVSGIWYFSQKYYGDVTPAVKKIEPTITAKKEPVAVIKEEPVVAVKKVRKPRAKKTAKKKGK